MDLQTFTSAMEITYHISITIIILRQHMALVRNAFGLDTRSLRYPDYFKIPHFSSQAL